MLSGVSHVVVDEVHERSLDSDFLVLCLRRVVERRRDLRYEFLGFFGICFFCCFWCFLISYFSRFFRIILMSATADSTRFATYFESIPQIPTVPTFSIPGRSYPVEMKFLEDIIEATGFVVEAEQRGGGMRDGGFVSVTGKGGEEEEGEGFVG